MAVLLKIVSVWVSFIQIMQVRVQNKGKSVWKSRYDGDVSKLALQCQRQIYVLETLPLKPGSGATEGVLD